MGKEYLVEGAMLMCVNGSSFNMLKIPIGHGYTSAGKKKANCRDCKACMNIPYFGACRKNEKTHLCEGYMLLADKWESTGGTAGAAEKVDGEEALTMDSVLLCRKGGVIMPLTSGQGYEKGIDWGAFMKRFQKVVGWVAGKNLMCQVFGGDPINMNTGNFIYEREDLKIPGITQLSFHLFYNSLEQDRNGCLGEGWHHNYEIHIREEEAGSLLYVCLGDGRELPYRPAIGDLYAPLLGDRGLLKKEGELSAYHTPEGSVYTFDRQGQLLARKDRNGNTDTFSHNKKGQLIQVKGANGGELFYSYNREGKLISVRDHAGREICLRYRYGKLYQYVNPAGHAYTYAYNEDGKLESVTTPRKIVGVKNTYDGAGRVVKQEMPDGGRIELLYDDENNRTYQKEPNGNLIVYESDERFRNVRTIYEDGEEIYAYNDKNQKTLSIDKNGNKTRYSYDERGNLTGVTDAMGIQRSLAYDAAGRLLGISIEGKEVLSNTYDETGHLTRTSDALRRSREITCNEKGQPRQVIQPDGSRYLITYDEKGNICTITDPYGSTVRYAYDALNRVQETIDEEGNRIRYRYDERDHLLAVTSPEGNTRRYFYNESGKPVRIEDFDGGILSVSYNAMGKPECLTDKEGRILKRSYDLMGNLAEEVSPTGTVTSCRYDKNGRLTEVLVSGEGKEGEGRTVYTYGYDPAGNLLHSAAGDGRETLSETFYEYDALNRITAITDPAGGRTAYTYDQRTGKVSSITDPAGNQRTFIYNDAGELTEETDIRGNTTRYEYNLLGQICSITDGAGKRTRNEYEPGGRLVKTLYPDGRRMHYTYDRLGRISSKSDGQGYRLNYTYDSMGRITRVKSSEGQEKSYTYDALGNVTAMTDALGNETRYAYTLSGKLKAVTDALGNSTEYAYDAGDRLIHVIQHGQEGEADRTTEYERNAFGQVECVRDASGGEEFYRYDALGRMREKTDREGLRTQYAYTPDGRPQSILYGDGRKAEFEYTHLRQLSMLKDWLGETIIERDQLGDPVRITDHAGRSVSYEWGAYGERKAMTYPDGTIVGYGYDEGLRLAKLERYHKEKEALCITYRYDEAGRLAEKEDSGGYRTSWHYNGLNQLEELIHENSQGILDRYSYSYDAMGNKTGSRKERSGRPEESGSYVYTYDALNRLNAVEKDGAILRSYQYDSFGNRIGRKDHAKGLQSTYTYDALNRLVQEEIWKSSSPFPEDGGWENRWNQDPMKEAIGKSYTYDRRGNMTGEYQEEKLLHGYEFDALNRLERAWDNTGKEAEYFYNGLGQRTGRRTNEKQEDYLLDLTRAYHNLLGLETGEERQNFYWDFGVAAMEDKDRIPRYYLQDELGSPLRVLYGNGNGNIYGYDEFGGELYEAPDPEKEASNRYSRQGEGQPFGYTGYRYDAVGGTYFAQAREYKAEFGRFTAEDVVRGNNTLTQTLNRYVYCWNYPIDYVDLDGKSPITQQQANEIIWNYYLSELNNTINAKKAEWYQFTYSVKEEIDNIANDIKTGVSNALDDIVEITNSKVQEVKEFLGNYDFTFTSGCNASFTPSFWQFDGNIGWAVDSDGNFGIQASYNGGVTVGTPSLTGSAFISFSNAPSIYHLEGPGSSIGGSAAIPLAYGIPLALGGEFNIIGDVNDFSQKYYGMTILAGTGVAAGGEGHIEWGETVTLFSYNMFDLWDYLYKNYKNGMEVNCESCE